MAILGQLSFSLVDLDQHSWLVVSVGGKDLGLLGGDGGVPGDQNGHDTSCSFNTQRKRGNVQKKQVLDLLISLASQDGSLDCSSVGHGLVGVD